MDRATQIAEQIIKTVFEESDESTTTIERVTAILRTVIPPDQVPELEIDRKLYKDCKMGANAKLERRIVWRMFAHLASKGWTPCQIDDRDEKTDVTSTKAAMELIFNLDDSFVIVRNASGRKHWIRLILGNGIDVISDYSYSETTDFAAAMEAFNPESCE